MCEKLQPVDQLKQSRAKNPVSKDPVLLSCLICLLKAEWNIEICTEPMAGAKQAQAKRISQSYLAW